MRQPQVDLGEKNEPRGRRTGGRSRERSIDPKAPNREEVPPGRLRKNLLVQRQVRDRAAQPLVLLLKLLEAAKLVAAYPAILLAPPEIRDRTDPEPPDRVRHQHALAVQNLHNPLPSRRSIDLLRTRV